MRFHITFRSRNQKTGPMPVVTSSRDTCPRHCPLRDEGCYARHGPLGWHWTALDEGRTGHDLDTLLAHLKTLPPRTLWRYGQAGDLPGDGGRIDVEALDKIVHAQEGRNGYAYTHYLASPRNWSLERWLRTSTARENAKAIAKANAAGFTVNLSAESLAHADALAALEVAPVVAVVPEPGRESSETPEGRRVVPCPHYSSGRLRCDSCGLCARRGRDAIVALPASASLLNVVSVFALGGPALLRCRICSGDKASPRISAPRISPANRF